MDIYRDRMVSFYREGIEGTDYPVIAGFDIASNTGQWYTIRFECDFSDPDLLVQVYRDDIWIGELKADSRNATSQTRIRILAFSRGDMSGPAECHVDRVIVSSLSSEYYSTGSYTSEVLELNASSLDTFTWDEVPASPYPWHDWVKYSGNPIIVSPSLPENMLVDIEDPLQQPIQYNGRYWLCYSAGGSTIRLAYSTDPELQAWTDYESNPVLFPVAGESYVFSPHLFRDGSIYYMFYDVALSSDSRQRIAYATAPAPTGPWTRGQIVLERGDPGEWDDFRVAEPFVVKDEDTYYLYFMGNYSCNGCIERIGLATTTAALFPQGAESGGHWTKYGVVLSPDTDPTEWDGVLVSNPSIVKSDNIYYMRYSGSTDNVDWRTGAAWATDLYGPWHHPLAPDMEYGPPGSWDDQRILRGAIHFHNGKWYSPYAGNDGSGGWESYRGGMATAEPRLPEDSLLLETRSSPDGYTWEEWHAAANGSLVQSSPGRFFQYRASFNLSDNDLSPILTDVSLTYVAGTTTGDGNPPFALRMHHPFPNPFNPHTVVGFRVDRRRLVQLTVYDVRGALVARIAERLFDPGYHEVAWNGNNDNGHEVSSGVYFVRMRTELYHETKRLILIR